MPRTAAFGTDFDGGFGMEATPNEIDTVADLAKFPDALASAGFSDEQVRGIMGEQLAANITAWAARRVSELEVANVFFTRSSSIDNGRVTRFGTRPRCRICETRREIGDQFACLEQCRWVARDRSSNRRTC